MSDGEATRGISDNRGTYTKNRESGVPASKEDEQLSTSNTNCNSSRDASTVFKNTETRQNRCRRWHIRRVKAGRGCIAAPLGSRQQWARGLSELVETPDED